MKLSKAVRSTYQAMNLFVVIETDMMEEYGGRAFSQKRWPDLCCDFEKEEGKNIFFKNKRKYFKNWKKKRKLSQENKNKTK